MTYTCHADGYQHLSHHTRQSPAEGNILKRVQDDDNTIQHRIQDDKKSSAKGAESRSHCYLMNN